MLRYNFFFFTELQEKCQKKEYNENLSIQEILSVCYDLCNEIKKFKANFEAFQSNKINLKDTFNVLNLNLSSLS